MPFFLEVLDELHGAALAVFLGLEGCIRAGVLEHRQVVHGNVRARGGVGRWREVVGVGLTRHLEDGDGDFFLDLGAAGEPFGIGPALHHVFGHGVAGLGFVGHVVEEVEHQERLLERSAGDLSHLSVVEQLDERMHVVAAHHGAQKLSGFGLGDQAHLDVAMGYSSQEAGLDLGGIVHARGHAVGDEVHEELALACGWALEQLNDVGHLLG